MKTIITLVITMLFTTLCLAQNGINYKAIIKNASGNVVAGQPVTIQFTILKGVAQTNVNRENRTPTTNAHLQSTLKKGLKLTQTTPFL